jgi:hypothetical protein
MTTTDKQRALYAEFVPPRTDGGLPYSVEDHIHQIKLAKEHGLSERGLADALGVPVNYITALKATLTA